MQKLGHDEVRNLVVDRHAEEDDSIPEQARVDVERALPARVLFDHHRDERAHEASIAQRPPRAGYEVPRPGSVSAGARETPHFAVYLSTIRMLCPRRVRSPVSVGRGSEKSVSGRPKRQRERRASTPHVPKLSCEQLRSRPSGRSAAAWAPEPRKGAFMSSDQNKAIVRRLLEEPWKGDLRVVDELVDPKYVGYDPAIPEPLRGPEGFKENISTYRTAYSDAHITVDDQIARADKVATRWTGTGTP